MLTNTSRTQICHCCRPDIHPRGVKLSDDDTELVWYFAFGSNMSPDTLGKVRKVFPVQSKACKVLGYTLTFSHTGLPYIEPGFGTIEPLSWHPVPPTLRIASSSPDQSAATSGKATMYSTPDAPVASALKAAVAADANTAAIDTSSPKSRVANGSPVVRSPELPISFGPANGTSKSSRVSPATDEPSDTSHQSSTVKASHQPSSVNVTQSSSHLHNGRSTAEASDQTASDSGVLVHGVVHRISQAEMRQIIKTESGGGSGNHGYYTERVQCELYSGGHVQALTLLSHPSSVQRQVSTPRSHHAWHTARLVRPCNFYFFFCMSRAADLVCTLNRSLLSLPKWADTLCMAYQTPFTHIPNVVLQVLSLNKMLYTIVIPVHGMSMELSHRM